MTQRWYVRAALAAILGLGATGLARPQAPATAPSPEPWAIIERGAGGHPPIEPASMEAPGTPYKGPVRNWLHTRPKPVQDYVHDCMHSHGVDCWSHHNSYTCGSFKSEWTFVFGSCREFFGEPCLPGPPQPPMPPGYPPLNGPGNGNSGYGRKAGCPNCQ
jgi:hypothetical protein